MFSDVSDRVKISKIYAALFREIEMLIRCKEDPTALYMGIIRLMVQFGAAETNVDQLFSYIEHAPQCMLDCRDLLEMATPAGRSYLRRALISRGEFDQLRRLAELSAEPLALKELVAMSQSLVRLRCKQAIESFCSFVHTHPEFSDFDRIRLTRPLRQLDHSIIHHF